MGRARGRKAVAIRHLAFEDLGLLAPLLQARGYDIAYVEAAAGVAGADVDADLLVVLGGPMGVYEADRYTFLADEIDILARRLAAGAPTLGVCLGAQLMAAALGARVYPATKEIGWAPLTLTAEGLMGPLAALGAETPVLHWHGDTFDLPAGALRLAGTAACANQAFAVGAAALALQFHLETPAAAIEQWLVGHAAEIAEMRGVSPQALRTQTAQAAASVSARLQVLADWLDRLPNPDG